MVSSSKAHLAHLLNLSPIASVAEWDSRLWGPVMALSVWVRRERSPQSRMLPSVYGFIKGSAPRVFVTDTVPVPSPAYDRRLFLEREYYVPLDDVLHRSKALSKERLSVFVQTAVEPLQGRRALVSTMPNQRLHPTAAARQLGRLEAPISGRRW